MMSMIIVFSAQGIDFLACMVNMTCDMRLMFCMWQLLLFSFNFPRCNILYENITYKPTIFELVEKLTFFQPVEKSHLPFI